MRNTSGIKMNWPLIAIALAVIGVPMAVAVIQDLGKDSDDEEILDRIGRLSDISDEEPTIDEAPDLEEADDIAGRWQKPAMDQAFFDEVFLGGPAETRPALRGPLADVRFGQTRQQMGEESPSLQDWLMGEPASTLERARLELGISGLPDERIMSIAVVFPDDGTAARVLASRWGEPLLVVGNDDLARRIWTNPGTGIRVVLEQHDGEARATFTRFLPVREYISRSGRFLFETHRILGATPEFLDSKYGAAFELGVNRDVARLDCPGIEVSSADLTCAIGFAGGKAVSLTVTIDHSFDPDGGPAVFAALRDRLGEVRKQSGDEHRNSWTFDLGITVTQVAGIPAITVERVAP